MEEAWRQDAGDLRELEAAPSLSARLRKFWASGGGTDELYAASGELLRQPLECVGVALARTVLEFTGLAPVAQALLHDEAARAAREHMRDSVQLLAELPLHAQVRIC